MRVGYTVMQRTRREWLRDMGLLSFGTLAGAGGLTAWDRLQSDIEPVASKPQATARAGKERGHATVTWAVETTKKLVALTFDDGPVPNYTPLTLDALDAADVPATFFLVGKRLVANAHILEGRLKRHEVGNHTWSHKDVSLLDFEAAHAEIKKAHEAISKIIGREPRLFRPPFGHVGTLPMRAADKYDYEVILWSHGVNEREFQKDPDSVVPYVVDNIVPGTIFLAHDAGADKAQPVFLNRIERIVSDLRRNGYEFVTVSELLARREPGVGLPSK